MPRRDKAGGSFEADLIALIQPLSRFDPVLGYPSVASFPWKLGIVRLIQFRREFRAFLVTGNCEI